MINSNVTTITLDGNETAVEFSKGYPYYQITNKGDDNIFVSFKPNISPKADGTYTIAAGETARLGEGYRLDTLYILGTGEAYIRGEMTAFPTSFKHGGKGGDGGGGMIADVLLDITVSIPRGVRPGNNGSSPINNTILTLPNNISDYSFIIFTHLDSMGDSRLESNIVSKLGVGHWLELVKAGDEYVYIESSAISSDVYRLYLNSDNTIKITYTSDSTSSYDRTTRDMLVGYK